MTTVAVPLRLQRVVGIRWIFATLLVALGLGAWSAGGAVEGLFVAAAVLVYNALIAWRLKRVPAHAVAWTVPQLVVDSLVTVAAVHYGQVLTPAAQFLFLFPLIGATLLWPREGLFLVAGLCSVGYAVGVALEVNGLWPAAGGAVPEDPVLGALTATFMVICSLLAAAGILNYLIRTLDGIEQDLAQSEDAYRRLATSLEEQVRQRTADLQASNTALGARNHELLQFQAINDAIHSSDDLGTVLQRVVDSVGEILPQAEAAMLLREPESAKLRLARVSTSAERLLGACEAILRRGLRDGALTLREGTPLEFAVRTRQLVISHDLATLVRSHLGPRYSHAVVEDLCRTVGFHSLLAVPLVMGDELVGLLAVGSRRVIESHDIERIEVLATQAGIAVHRVRQEQMLLEQQASLAQAYRELEHTHEQALNLEKMRAVGEMTSGVAHNFNNALTAILGSTQLILREEHLPSSAIARMRVIEQVSQDASLLVQRLRSFSRDEALVCSPNDPSELVRESIAITEPRWRHHADRVEYPIEMHLDLRARRLVDVDAAAMREVLINLILNAVNAMSHGGDIYLSTRDVGDQVRIAVRDTGVGMDEETRQRCFEPFFTTGGKASTGLGLSVAFGVVQRLNGTLTVESAPGEGAEFTLSLPALEQTADAVPLPPPDEARRSRPPAIVSPLHVLVVDDQSMVRQTLGEMLQALGHMVTLAACGQEALDLFDPARHQVVITDWGMPGMSGLQVARSIKGRSPGTPIVLVTGFDTNLPRDVVESDEVDARLQKPVALNTLAATIADVAAPGRRYA